MAKVEKAKLLEQLEQGLSGIAQREMIEQSSCFVFTDGFIHTFNDEIYCRVPTELDIVGAVPSKIILETLKKIKDTEIEITVDENKLNIRGKSKTISINMQEEIFLPISEIKVPDEFKKLPEEFIEAIELTKNCASKNESNFNFTCVHITSDFIESCDNSQVLRYDLKTGFKKEILIKADSIKHIVQPNMSYFAENENWMFFKNQEDFVLGCRRHVLDYPDCSSILEGEGNKITLPKGLDDAIEAANLFTKDNIENDRIIVTLKKGRVLIKGEGIHGSYKEVKKANYTEDEINFTISPMLLKQITKTYNECELTSNKLLVKNAKYSYATCLGIIDDE